VLVAEGAPRTAALLAERGLRVYPIATTQVARADGALSCCAILFP
jgi:N-dimethylarginine dimethylaminohydrolase